MLRPGNAGSNTAADHVVVIREGLRQLPLATTGRVGRKVLVRIDGAGATNEVLDYLVAGGLSYSVGFTLPDTTPELWGRVAVAPTLGAMRGPPYGRLACLARVSPVSPQRCYLR